MGIRAANREYERWLKAQLHGGLVEADLKKKHKKMRASAFAFLRATYWRWAETILDVCPDLADAPAVLAVGDTHLENFGTWTDKEGRIVWGVNDYDETAEMPYILDLVRLATSAALAATPSQLSLKAICNNLFEGYEQGVDAPEAFVLDHQHMWLRNRFVVGEAQRAIFWRKIENQYHDLLAKKNPEQPPARWLKLFAGALPDSAITMSYWRHTAGTGSLGRPRWLGFGNWHGGPVLREGKALVPSGWTRVHRDGGRIAPQRHFLRPLPLARSLVRGERQYPGAAAVAQQPQDRRRGPPRRRAPAASRPAVGDGSRSRRHSSRRARPPRRPAQGPAKTQGALVPHQCRDGDRIRRPRIRRIQKIG